MLNAITSQQIKYESGASGKKNITLKIFTFQIRMDDFVFVETECETVDVKEECETVVVKEERETVGVKEECETVDVKEECETVVVKEECETVDVKVEYVETEDPLNITSKSETGDLAVNKLEIPDFIKPMFNLTLNKPRLVNQFFFNLGYGGGGQVVQIMHACISSKTCFIEPFSLY